MLHVSTPEVWGKRHVEYQACVGSELSFASKRQDLLDRIVELETQVLSDGDKRLTYIDSLSSYLTAFSEQAPLLRERLRSGAMTDVEEKLQAVIRSAFLSLSSSTQSAAGSSGAALLAECSSTLNGMTGNSEAGMIRDMLS